MGINLTGSNDDVEATDVMARGGRDDEQMSKGSLAMAWYGVASAMFFVYIGAAMAVAYGTVDAIIGIVLTIIVYGLITMLLAKHSIEHRTTVAKFSRSILGTSGSAIATIIFALVAIYYAVFEGLIVAYAFQAAFGGEMWLWSLVIVLYSTPLIIGGVRRFLDKLNGWLMPLYIGGLVTACIWASIQYGATDAWLTHVPEVIVPFASGGPGWLATFAGYMGIWIMMMFTMDYAALGRRKDVRFHQVVTFGPLFYVLAYGFSAFVGIYLTFTIPGLQVTESGVAGGLVGLMGLFGLLVVFASQTRINTANYYLGAANLKAFTEQVTGVRLPNIVFVIASSVIIYLLMLLPIIQYILVALAWQGALVTAWVAIAVVHMLMDRHRRREHGDVPDSAFRAFHAPGIIAWTAATAIGIFFIQAGISWGGTWGPILTATIAGLLYGILRSAMGTQSALQPEYEHEHGATADSVASVDRGDWRS